jgi:23S rRNA (guanosine2251-2'-O)-methyltransferase
MRKLSNRELNRKHVDEFKNASKTPIIIILDNVRSLNNIGSVFRTADAFLVEAIYLTGICAQPPHREIHKTALGATETVHWEYFEEVKDAVLKVKEKAFELVLIEQTDNSVALEDYVPNKDKKGIALVFGNEVKGVSDSIIPDADLAVEIAQFGSKHSINISVCAGIVVHWVFQKL